MNYKHVEVLRRQRFSNRGEVNETTTTALKKQSFFLILSSFKGRISRQIMRKIFLTIGF